jgi:hypothetical protein
MHPRPFCEENLLSRLARHCPECQLIQAKDQRNLPLEGGEKQHLLFELYFIRGTRSRPHKRHPTLKRWPRS